MSTEAAEPVSTRVGYRLKLAQHALRTRMDDVLRPHGISAPQYAVLAAIEEAPGISSAALARTAFVTAQTMQGIVANLERAGLLSRESDPGHGRVLRTSLTAEGHAVLRRAHGAVAAVEAAMLDGLSPREVAALSSLLARCAAALAS